MNAFKHRLVTASYKTGGKGEVGGRGRGGGVKKIFKNPNNLLIFT